MSDWGVYNQVFSNIGSNIASALMKKAQAGKDAEIIQNIINAGKQVDDINNLKKPVDVNIQNPNYKPYSTPENDVLNKSIFGIPANNGTNYSTPATDYVSAPSYKETVDMPLNRTEKYQKQTDIINNILAQVVANKDISPEGLQKAQALSGILQSKANWNKPFDPSMMTLQEGSQVYYRDTEGNLKKIAENPKDFAAREALKPSYDLQKGRNGHLIAINSKNPKDTYDTGIEYKPDKGTTVNINNKAGKEEKWKGMGNLIAQMKDPALKNEKDKAYYADKARREAYDNLVPSAKKWYDENIKGKSNKSWGREDMSNADFIAEANEALKNGDITVEAHQDLLDFAAYRPDLWNTDTKSYHSTNQGK